jgi:mRNA interferase RelE/StbE
MVKYEDEVLKSIKKSKLPKDIFILFHHAFIALEKTNDLNLFDIKRLRSNIKRTYYRLRKNKYRAIFYIENDNYFVISIAKREEVYKQWE